jgi:DNA-directed RNA polymerase sigma subunit (sigma70/sigma32)
MKKSILVNPDEIQLYIKDLRKIPVMSHQRQEEVFELLNNKKTDKETRGKLYNELVVGNLRFVISVAKMFQNQGMCNTLA